MSNSMEVPATKVLKRKSAVGRDANNANQTIELPAPIANWFEVRGWQLRAHQRQMLVAARARQSTLLIAPTGAGKTLAGFLPTFATAATASGRSRRQLKTLYVSPLKALAADVTRNVTNPVLEMDLRIRAELRTGDTSVAVRQRQKTRPPDILLTTPEQVSLLLSQPFAHELFANLETIILDELHALAGSKRGDLLALAIARLRKMAPNVMTIGLSATVAAPTELQAFLVPQRYNDQHCTLANVITVEGGAQPDISIVEGTREIPWSGHTSRHAMTNVYDAIKDHRLTIIFVNTRMQAEFAFQELWRMNEDSLAIALHHGSLELKQRKKVEAAMADGSLQAVVATSTLDLGIDWGDVDLVIHLGAPKGASRLLQRIGRANHRLEEPSRALLVPGNRFEVLECRAALEAAKAGSQDVRLNRTGALDVLAQHILGCACHAAFSEDELFDEVTTALPYAQLTRDQLRRTIDFVATGGYALRNYERFAKLRRDANGSWSITNERVARQYRLNIGTIVDTPLLKVRLTSKRKKSNTFSGGRVLGDIDEAFAEQLAPGDTFVFAGEILCFEGLREGDVFVTRTNAESPKIPSYGGSRFPMSTHLAQRVRDLVAEQQHWRDLPSSVAEWLELQSERSVIPGPDDVLIETFPRQSKNFLVAYPFEGRLAHQTLGVLLTRRLERAKCQPLGFVANDYALAVWAKRDISAKIGNASLNLADLFDQDMLGDDLDAWLADCSVMKRTFRSAAVIAGLIERRHPGREKSGRQVTMSTDLIYDVLRRHDPHHLLLEAAWADAATGLLDIARLSSFLACIKGRILHRPLNRVSPLAVPILLEIGKEQVYGSAQESVLREAAEQLIREGTGES